MPAAFAAAEVLELFRAVGRLSAPGSQLAFEQFAGAEALRAKVGRIPSMRGVATLWKGGLGAGTADWLAGHGWRVRTVDRGPLAAAGAAPPRTRPRAVSWSPPEERTDEVRRRLESLQ